VTLNRHLVVVLAVAVALAGGALLVRGMAPEPAPADLAFPFLDGRTVSLNDLHGRPVLVTFWATTCPVCRREMPDLAALYRELHPRGLEIIAVAMPYDRPDRVLGVATREKLPFPVALDIEGRAVHAFGGVTATPTRFLIDAEGNIVLEHVGSMDPAELRERIIELLAPA
jgi:peroxiredoxin